MYIYIYAIEAREMRRVRRTSALTLICFYPPSRLGLPWSVSVGSEGEGAGLKWHDRGLSECR